jgi:hypothetical protein
MKKLFPLIIVAVSSGLALAENEVWYDWQGKPLGLLPAEFPSKIQPSDLVKHHKELIPAVTQPWSNHRRSRRIADWYYYDYGNYSRYYSYFPRYCSAPPPRQGLQLWYKSGGQWGGSFQRPGLSLQW